MNWIEMIDIDLPSLQSIQLGCCSLDGRDDDESCSLIMRSITKMNLNNLPCRSSKSNIHYFQRMEFL